MSWRERTDAQWAWYVYVFGFPISEIANRLLTTREDVKLTLKRVAKGELPYVKAESADYVLERYEWTKRHDLVLRKLRKYGRSLEECAALLERPPERLKKEWQRIKNENG